MTQFRWFAAHPVLKSHAERNRSLTEAARLATDNTDTVDKELKGSKKTKYAGAMAKKK